MRLHSIFSAACAIGCQFAIALPAPAFADSYAVSFTTARSDDDGALRQAKCHRPGHAG